MATIERNGTPWLTIDCGGEGLTAYAAHYGDAPRALFITHTHLDHVAGFERLFVSTWFDEARRGKVRLHRSPDARERAACRIWLERELVAVRPQVIVCLGAIAAKAVLGSGFRLMAQRGTWQELGDGTRVMATVHPSFVLRQRDDDARHEAYASLLADLSLLKKLR